MTEGKIKKVKVIILLNILIVIIFSNLIVYSVEGNVQDYNRGSNNDISQDIDNSRFCNSSENNPDIHVDFNVSWMVKPWLSDPLDPRYDQKYCQISPAAEEKVKVLLTNKGNINDTYELSISGLLKGWRATFTENDLPNYSVSLDAKIYENSTDYNGSGAEIDVYITVPVYVGLDDISKIRVTGISKYSRNNPAIEELICEDVLMVEGKICRGCLFMIDSRDPYAYVDPGGNATFCVDIKNGYRSEIIVAINHGTIPIKNWNITHPLEIIIPPGSKQEFKVVVTAPLSALAGEKLIFRIEGNIINGDYVNNHTSTVFVVVTKILCRIGVESEAELTIKAVNPGECVEYNITISNTGNGETYVEVNPTVLRSGWGDVIFIFESREYYNSFQTTIEYGSEIMITLRLNIPFYELTGSYTTSINVSARDNYQFIYFETFVNQTYDLSLSVFDENENSYKRTLINSISPGWELSYVFKVENQGNGPETIELQLNGLDRNNVTGWQGYFHAVAKTRIYTTNVEKQNFTEIIDASTLPKDLVLVNNGNTEVDIIRLKLNAGQRAYISIKLTAPRFSNDNIEENTIGLAVISAKPALENPIDNEVELVFELLLPDLVIDSIYHPRYIEEGDVITISTYIKNFGDIEAKNINVALFVDDKFVKSVNIIRVQNGTDDLFVTFCWQAIGGQHEVKIELDLYDTIPEDNDQFSGKNNNIAIKTVTVTKSSEILRINSDLILIITTICTFIILLIFVMYLKFQLLMLTQSKLVFNLKNLILYQYLFKF